MQFIARQCGVLIASLWIVDNFLNQIHKPFIFLTCLINYDLILLALSGVATNKNIVNPIFSPSFFVSFASG